MTASEKEYGRRAVKVTASGEEPKLVYIPLSEVGWVGDDAEVEWCSLIREAIKHKLAKLPNFRPAFHHDLLIYDDMLFLVVDRRKVFAVISPWVRRLNETKSSFGKISVIISLDVLFDLGGVCRIFPYIYRSAPE